MRRFFLFLRARFSFFALAPTLPRSPVQQNQSPRLNSYPANRRGRGPRASLYCSCDGEVADGLGVNLVECGPVSKFGTFSSFKEMAFLVSTWYHPRTPQSAEGRINEEAAPWLSLVIQTALWSFESGVKGGVACQRRVSPLFLCLITKR